MLLAYVEGRNAAGQIHEGEFADVGATVNAWLGGKAPSRGIPGQPIVVAPVGTATLAMPELPEVESVRRQLEPALVGRRFERVSIDDPRLVRPYEPAEVAAELEGERVAAVERRGKYLIVRFESGRVLLIHLRMTGSLLQRSERVAPGRPASPRCCQVRRRVGRRIPRRPTLRHVAAARARRS